ncbi:MAG: prkC 7 [Planctomycetaceae bacterium]|nr:prkC 7 [Planctomycetaceae bacterium]
MNQNMAHFDRDCLRRLLEDTLPEPFASEVAAHVAECAECGSQLESLAGLPEWWSQACSGVKAILADPAAYVSNTSDISVGPESFASVTASATNEEAFTSDFAVDFLEPSDDPKILGRLGEYEILEIIGRGGMGIVLKGFQRQLNRYVAVKVLAPHLAMSAAAQKRFAREAQATAAVVHPHVMAIHAVAGNAKLPYLVMPFVACESLQQRLDRLGPLDLKDTLRIGMQAALGLAAAHAQGLVHRDVKPANILLETSVDRVMLTDFGLARAVDDATLTRTGIIAGTPQYMSPEQAQGDAVDHRSDLFSLGSVLYAMCTGRPPFRAETTFGVLRRIRETAPRPIREINPDVPVWFECIVLKLLSKSSDDRNLSATELATLLEQCLAHVQQPTTISLPETIANWAVAPISADIQPSQTNRMSRPAIRTIVIGVALMIFIGLISIWLRTTPIPAKQTETDSMSEEPATADISLEWNATQDELEDMTQDIAPLEANGQRDLEILEIDHIAADPPINKEAP